MFFLILILLAIFSNINADIPVHCRKEKIQGDWIFKIDSKTFTPSLDQDKTTCGHGFPDHIDQTIGEQDYKFDTSTTIEAKLGADFKAYQNGAVVGTWTAVYDEGFILNINNIVITAYMKYYKTSNGVFKSDCDKTMKGWYLPNKDEKDKNWSCMYGIKKGSVTGNPTKTNFLKTNLVNPKHQRFVEVKEKESNKDNNYELGLIQLKTNTFMNQKYEDHLHIVNELNGMGLTWNAGINEDFKGMSLLELNNHPKMGMKRMNYEKEDFSIKPSNLYEQLINKQQPSLLQMKNKLRAKKFDTQYDKDVKALDKLNKENPELSQNKIEETSSETSDSNSYVKKSMLLNPIEEKVFSQGKHSLDSTKVTNYDEVVKYIDTEVDQIDESILPKNWDWRNVGGKNYVPKTREQKSCGSCYIFSTLSSLEARLRIQTNLADTTEFSRQFIVSCAIYTEGCKGGYPILVGKFAHEFELVPDGCMNYEGRDESCSKRCDPSVYKNKYTVSRYEYLGGYYGGTSELLMMKEIRARGPMPGNISVPWSFSYYKGGIYANFNNKSPSSSINKATMFDNNVTWEKVDHSILIVGWGEENGVKFWICMNTWGANWGENGFFRILRGKNECSIESMGDVMRIKKEAR